MSSSSADLCRLGAGEGGVWTSVECGILTPCLIIGASFRLEVAGRAGERESRDEDELGRESVPAGDVFLEEDVLICSR